MPANFIGPEARRENALALASALGLGVDEAAQSLSLHIAITVDPADAVAEVFGRELRHLLRRTVGGVEVNQTVGLSLANLEVVVGSVSPRSDRRQIYVGLRKDRALFAVDPLSTNPCEILPPILILLAACYAAGFALHHALDRQIPYGADDRLEIPFDELGVTKTALAQPVELGHAYLAGAGAIGNGFLWAARHLDFRGTLEVVDDDRVSGGNLNRQIWFEREDIDASKAERLVSLAQPFFPSLSLRFRDCPTCRSFRSDRKTLGYRS